jgi:hypothetical protein
MFYEIAVQAQEEVSEKYIPAKARSSESMETRRLLASRKNVTPRTGRFVTSP